MSKPRKKLDETAKKFIFGEEKLHSSEAEPPEPEPLPKSQLLEKLTPTERVKPIRVSLDLDPETHKRLTVSPNGWAGGSQRFCGYWSIRHSTKLSN